MKFKFGKIVLLILYGLIVTIFTFNSDSIPYSDFLKTLSQSHILFIFLLLMDLALKIPLEKRHFACFKESNNLAILFRLKQLLFKLWYLPLILGYYSAYVVNSPNLFVEKILYIVWGITQTILILLLFLIVKDFLDAKGQGKHVATVFVLSTGLVSLVKKPENFNFYLFLNPFHAGSAVSGVLKIESILVHLILTIGVVGVYILLLLLINKHINKEWVY